MRIAMQRLAKMALVPLLGLGLSQGAMAATALVASKESHSIEQFDESGNWVRTFASTGPYAPRGIARNAEGDVYVANVTDTILRFDKTGKPSPISAAFTVPTSGNPIVAVIFDSKGNLYADTYLGDHGKGVTIYKFTPAQLAQAVPVGTVLVNSKLGRADQMAFDRLGHLCVANILEQAQCFNTQTGALAFDYTPELQPFGIQPVGLGFDSQNRLIVSSTFVGTVLREKTARMGPLQTLTSGLTPGLYYLALDNRGFIYVPSWHGVNSRPSSNIPCGANREFYACNDYDFTPDVIYKIDPVSGAATTFIDSHVWGPTQIILTPGFGNSRT